MFEYALPVPVAAATKKPDDKKPKGKGDKDDDKKKVVHTQAKPEKPGDDLGYDPRKIPVEEIPDD